MRIQSYTHTHTHKDKENLNSRVFFFFPSAKSKEAPLSPYLTRYRIRPESWYETRACVCVSDGKDVSKNVEINLDATYILYTRFVKAPWKKSRGMQTPRGVEKPLSLAVDISGSTLFKDMPLLFKARRCKNTCHRMRVVHTKARTIGRYWYMGISMREWQTQKALGIEGRGAVRIC